MTLISKKKIIFLIVLVIILGLFYLVFMKGEVKEVPEISKEDLSEMDIYYARTELKNEFFEIVNDYEIDGNRRIIYMIPEEVEDKNLVFSMYDNRFDIHHVFNESLTPKDYKKITGGKTFFADSFTVTTIVFPKTILDNGKTFYGYGFTYIERDNITDLEGLISNTAKNYNKGELLFETKEDLDSYISKLKKYEVKG